MRQTYLFQLDKGDGNGLWTWGEVWTPAEGEPDGYRRHYAPTPFKELDEAYRWIATSAAADIVDVVTDGRELAEMRKAALGY